MCIFGLDRTSIVLAWDIHCFVIDSTRSSVLNLVDHWWQNGTRTISEITPNGLLFAGQSQQAFWFNEELQKMKWQEWYPKRISGGIWNMMQYWKSYDAPLLKRQSCLITITKSLSFLVWEMFWVNSDGSAMKYPKHLPRSFKKRVSVFQICAWDWDNTDEELFSGSGQEDANLLVLLWHQ